MRRAKKIEAEFVSVMLAAVNNHFEATRIVPTTRFVEAALPLVTVNILSFNRKEELRITLTKLAGSLNYPAEKMEIIVVDNASTDGTVAMLREDFPKVQVIARDVNVGISAWNDGFRKGRGDYFLVLDDDCYIEGDSLQLAAGNAVEHGADIVSFHAINPLDEGYSFNETINPGLLSFWGCAVLISRRAIEKLSGFDPNIFVYMHELEFSIRALGHGCQHLYLPQVLAFHMKPKGKALTASAAAGCRCSFNHGYIIGKLFNFDHIARGCAYTMVGYMRQYWRRPGLGLRLKFAFFRGLFRGLANHQPVNRETVRFYTQNYLAFRPPMLSLARQRMKAENLFRSRRSELYSLNQSALLSVREFVQSAT